VCLVPLVPPQFYVFFFLCFQFSPCFFPISSLFFFLPFAVSMIYYHISDSSFRPYQFRPQHLSSPHQPSLHLISILLCVTLSVTASAPQLCRVGFHGSCRVPTTVTNCSRVSFCDGSFYDSSLLRPLSSPTEHSRHVMHHSRNSSVLSVLSALLALFRCACVPPFSILVQSY
jgi:hypothetical protein